MCSRLCTRASRFRERAWIDALCVWMRLCLCRVSLRTQAQCEHTSTHITAIPHLVAAVHARVHVTPGRKRCSVSSGRVWVSGCGVCVCVQVHVYARGLRVRPKLQPYAQCRETVVNLRQSPGCTKRSNQEVAPQKHTFPAHMRWLLLLWGDLWRRGPRWLHLHLGAVLKGREGSRGRRHGPPSHRVRRHGKGVAVERVVPRVPNKGRGRRERVEREPHQVEDVHRVCVVLCLFRGGGGGGGFFDGENWGWGV